MKHLWRRIHVGESVRAVFMHVEACVGDTQRTALETTMVSVSSTATTVSVRIEGADNRVFSPKESPASKTAVNRP
eukprot:scaffold1388_cov390-Prasinococcus_capsulatus_cf.AAC.26